MAIITKPMRPGAAAIGHDFIDEVYHRRVETPQIRDLGFIVADDNGFWVEVKRSPTYTLTTAGAGIPAVQILHRSSHRAGA